MQINYHLTEEDYIHFNLFHIKNSDVAMKTLRIQRFISPIIFLTGAIVLYSFTETHFLITFTPFLIVSILWLLYYPKYFEHYIVRNTKKMIKEGKNDGLLGKHQMTLKEDGIVDSTANGETRVNWSGIQKVSEDEAYFYLYNSSVSAYILPKRELEDVAEIRQFLYSKIN